MYNIWFERVGAKRHITGWDLLRGEFGIEVFISEMPPEMLERVCQDWSDHLWPVTVNIWMKLTKINLYGAYYQFKLRFYSKFFV